jgi:hypothetical protein
MLRKRLLKMAEERTGGEETDRILRKQREEQEKKEHTNVVTPEGAEGAVPAMLSSAPAPGAEGAEGAPPAAAHQPDGTDAGEAVQAELFPGAVARKAKGKKRGVKPNRPAVKRKPPGR